MVYGEEVPELAGEVTTMLGWCDSALTKNAENKKVWDAAKVSEFAYIRRSPIPTKWHGKMRMY